MRYLLDTNIVSELIGNPQGSVTERVREVGESQVATSIIVAAELRYGAAKKGSARLKSRQCSERWKFFPSRIPPTACTAFSAPVSNRKANPLVATIC